MEVQVAVVGALLSKDVKNKDKDLKFLQDDDRRVAEDFVKCMKPLKSITTTLCTEKMQLYLLFFLFTEDCVISCLSHQKKIHML